MARRSARSFVWDVASLKQIKGVGTLIALRRRHVRSGFNRCKQDSLFTFSKHSLRIFKGSWQYHSAALSESNSLSLG